LALTLCVPSLLANCRVEAVPALAASPKTTVIAIRAEMRRRTPTF